MVRWLAAFDSFALAAEAAEVWTYAAAKSHLRVCMQIACEKFQVLLPVYHRALVLFVRPCFSRRP